MTLAADEAKQRHELDRRQMEIEVDLIRRDFGEARIGQICALVIGLAAFAVAGYVAVHGAEIAGSLIGVGGVSTIITSFLYGRRRTEDRESGRVSG